MCSRWLRNPPKPPPRSDSSAAHERAADRRIASDASPDAAAWLAAYEDFARVHLARWLVSFCSELAARSHHPFYRALGGFGAAFGTCAMGDAA